MAPKLSDEWGEPGDEPREKVPPQALLDSEDWLRILSGTELGAVTGLLNRECEQDERGQKPQGTAMRGREV